MKIGWKGDLVKFGGKAAEGMYLALLARLVHYMSQEGIDTELAEDTRFWIDRDRGATLAQEKTRSGAYRQHRV